MKIVLKKLVTKNRFMSSKCKFTNYKVTIKNTMKLSMSILSIFKLRGNLDFQNFSRNKLMSLNTVLKKIVGHNMTIRRSYSFGYPAWEN